MSFFNKIVNLSMYAGLKHKAFLTLINVFTKLIYVLKFEQSSDKLKYLSSKYLDFILIKSLRCKTSVTANDLLANLVHDVHPLFSLKTQKVKIKKRTKQKQRYKIRICYVKPKSRALVVLKWLVSGASWFSSQKWEDRLLKAMLNVIFGGNDSYLYDKKLKIYKQMVKTFKSRK